MVERIPTGVSKVPLFWRWLRCCPAWHKHKPSAGDLMNSAVTSEALPRRACRGGCEVGQREVSER